MLIIISVTRFSFYIRGNFKQSILVETNDYDGYGLGYVEVLPNAHLKLYAQQPELLRTARILLAGAHPDVNLINILKW